MSRNGVTIGIDIGTTAVKAVAADADGNVTARVRIPHRVRVPAPNRFEHDADEAWRRGPLAALDEVRQQVREPEPRAVAAWNAAACAERGATVAQLPRVEAIGAAAGQVNGTRAVLATGAVDALCECW